MSDIEIPIAVSQGTITETYLELVNNILRETAEINEDLSGLTLPSIHTKLVMDYLNFTVQDIWNRARWPFTQAQKVYAPQASQAAYDWVSDFVNLLSDPYHTAGQLRYISRDDLNLRRPDRSNPGTPSHWCFFQGQLILDPMPSEDWISDDVVTGTDANVYVCKLAHTATTDDTPITGVNYETYWTVDPLAASGSTWAVGENYTDKRIILEYYRAPVPMLSEGDTPDLPDRFVETLKTGTRARFKQHLEAQDALMDYQLYESKISILLHRRLQSQGPYKMRLNR